MLATRRRPATRCGCSIWGSVEGAAAVDLISTHYRAPEQHLGQPADERADIHALGAILYEMVTGAPPSAGRKLNEPVQSPRMFRPEIPMELERLILASLDRDPARRPPNMAPSRRRSRR
jgi:serine/threonine-protein kinase